MDISGNSVRIGSATLAAGAAHELRASVNTGVVNLVLDGVDLGARAVPTAFELLATGDVFTEQGMME